MDTEEELRQLLHQDDTLAFRIKAGFHKNRVLPVRLVDCAHNIQALREMLDVLAGGAQRARAKLDQAGVDYPTRFFNADWELEVTRRMLNEIADKQPRVEKRKREASVFRLHRKVR